jgi:integrase
VSKTELEVALLSRRSRQIELLPKVKTFIDSIARNSLRSKKAYSSGLSILQNFLNAEEQKQKYQRCNCETIIQPLLENKVNVYELLVSFVSYVLAAKPEITPRTLSLYLVAIRSYLAFYDIDVIPSKFRRRVKVPKLYKEDEEPIDASDIRKILLNCSNRRLKSYLLILTSSGMRAVEATAIRLKDIDFSTNPTKIHVRKEYTKTRSARDVYISDEAAQYLKQWIDWKQRLRSDQGRTFNQEDLVFSIYSINKEPNPCNLYVKLIYEFQKLLAAAGMAERKESGIHKRRKITLHSFRRFCKSVISNQVSQDYSEWFLGHSKSPYYTLKESERREIYATRVMKYLTLLDYNVLEVTGKNIEAKLTEKEKEIQLLQKHQEMRDDALTSLSDQVSKLMQEIEILKKQK